MQLSISNRNAVNCFIGLALQNTMNLKIKKGGHNYD